MVRPCKDPVEMVLARRVLSSAYNKTDNCKESQKKYVERIAKEKTDKLDKQYKLGNMYFRNKTQIHAYVEKVISDGITDDDIPQLNHLCKLSSLEKRLDYHIGERFKSSRGVNPLIIYTTCIFRDRKKLFHKKAIKNLQKEGYVHPRRKLFNNIKM
jgi:hypothetical protein